MIEAIYSIKNIGRFQDVSQKQGISLGKSTLIYAENGRGKTTLANILRSLGSDDSDLIKERKRVKSNEDSHIHLKVDGTDYKYANGRWQTDSSPDVAVFDDHYVSQNIYSGTEVNSEHRQNLHELIIGDKGISLKWRLKKYVEKREKYNSKIRETEGGIKAFCEDIPVDEFCKLERQENIKSAILETEREIEITKDPQPIINGPLFKDIALPEFDIKTIKELLEKELPNLQQETADLVKKHLQKLWHGAEDWIEHGKNKLDKEFPTKRQETCPFCAQDLNSSDLIKHYQYYFSENYKALKQNIITERDKISKKYSDSAWYNFIQSINIAKDTAEFWIKYIPDAPIENIHTIDTDKISNAWKTIRTLTLNVLEKKIIAPLERLQLESNIIASFQVYEHYCKEISQISQNLQKYNEQIRNFKKSIDPAKLENLKSKLVHQRLLQTRYKFVVVKFCKKYENEKKAKKIAQAKCDEIRKELNEHQKRVFKESKDSINKYLEKFAAGIRLNTLEHENNRGGASCNYYISITDINNDNKIPLNATGMPSFKSVLGGADRKNLALAFFFSSLEADLIYNQKIVVIDDPMTSLNEQRYDRIIAPMIELMANAKQVIILSHFKPFICRLWDEAKRNNKKNLSTIQIVHSENNSSNFENWEIDEDCNVRENEKRHYLILKYLKGERGISKKDVGLALRPMLESYLRLAYPEKFLPEASIGKFINACKQSESAILGKHDIESLHKLNKYASEFHHDRSGMQEIDGAELRDYCEQTLKFIKREVPKNTENSPSDAAKNS